MSGVFECRPMHVFFVFYAFLFVGESYYQIILLFTSVVVYAWQGLWVSRPITHSPTRWHFGEWQRVVVTGNAGSVGPSTLVNNATSLLLHSSTASVTPMPAQRCSRDITLWHNTHLLSALLPSKDETPTQFWSTVDGGPMLGQHCQEGGGIMGGSRCMCS